MVGKSWLLPLRALTEERLDTKRRAPIKISARIVSIPKRRRHGNNPLMSVIRERRKHMHNARSVLRGHITRKELW